MSQLKQFWFRKTKYLYRQGRPMVQHERSRLVQPLPILIPMHPFKRQLAPNHTHNILNKSRVDTRQTQSQKCYPTAIKSLPQQTKYEKREHQQNIHHKFLCKDIPILEKLDARPTRQSPTLNTLQTRKRKGKKRSFAIKNTYENKHGSHIQLKPPALKRQRMMLNNKNECHMQSPHQPQPPQLKQPQRLNKRSPLCNKRSRNPFAYEHEPRLKRRRRLYPSECGGSSCKTVAHHHDNKENRRNYNDTSKHILFICNILNDVMSCLDFHEILKLRRLSKFHEKEFYFKFGINKQLNDENFHLYFEYNNRYILNILKKQISNNLLNIAMYSLQCINYKIGKWFIKNCIISPPNSIISSNIDDDNIMGIPHKKLNLLSFEIHSDNKNKNDSIFEWSKNTQTIVECGENTHTSYFHTCSICNNVINSMFKYCGCRFKLHNENTFSFITHAKSNDNVNNCCSTGNSCNKSVCNSNFCSTGTGFIYSVNINPFRELHSQIKLLKKQISCLSFDINHMTEYMILGNIYHIKPLCTTLTTLLDSTKYDCFRQTIMNKKSERFKIDNKNRHCYGHGNHLMYLWSNMGLLEPCFSSTDKENYIIEGRQSLLSDLSVKGDFSHYWKFLSVYDNHTSAAMEGIEVLISMFLRRDLLDNFVFLSMYSNYSRQMLLCLLKPKILLTYKQHLLDSMIPLNETEEYEFALYENPRYSPENRVRFLWKLLFSTKFSFSHNRAAVIHFHDRHIELRQCINKLYNSFECFATEWELEKYESMKKDTIKQHQLYENFRHIVQALFGFCDCYNRSNHVGSDIFTIADVIETKRGEAKTQISNVNLKTDQDFEMVNSFAADDICKQFVNIMPQSELQLQSLWRFMSTDIAEKKIKRYLQMPRFEHMFQTIHQPQDDNLIVFDAVENTDIFVSKLWDIGESLGIAPNKLQHQKICS